jgi:hypothetical protein
MRSPMQEAAWLKCSSVVDLLEHLTGKVSVRKLRLFACACCRCLWGSFEDEPARKAVESAERFADGLETWGRMTELGRATRSVPGNPRTAPPRAVAFAEAASCCTYSTESLAAQSASNLARQAGGTERQQVALIREIFGNPFRPIALDPYLLAWSDGAIVSLARGIYEERAFERMPILGDALEEAGCTNQEILDHCRAPRDHVRGCWLLDALLSRQ